VRFDVSLYLKELITELGRLEMSEALFSEYEVLLEKLEKEVRDKEIYLDRYGKLKGKIEGLG